MKIGDGWILYPSGKPKIKYIADTTTYKCPKCKGKFDIHWYGKSICNRCGVKLNYARIRQTTYSGTPEFSKIKNK